MREIVMREAANRESELRRTATISEGEQLEGKMSNYKRRRS